MTDSSLQIRTSSHLPGGPGGSCQEKREQELKIAEFTQTHTFLPTPPSMPRCRAGKTQSFQIGSEKGISVIIALEQARWVHAP